MKYTLLILLVLSTLGCFKNNSFCTQTLLFDIPLKLTPSRDTFQIGDTIWLESNVNHSIEDLNSGSMVEIRDFDFKTRVGIYRFDIGGNAFDSFDFINKKGEFQVFTQFISMNYDSEENQRVIEIGLIPNQSGGFYFSFYNLLEDLHDVNLTESDCIETVDINYNMNDGKNNYHFIENLMNPTNTEAGFLKNGSYAFWVME